MQKGRGEGYDEARRATDHLPQVCAKGNYERAQIVGF